MGLEIEGHGQGLAPGTQLLRQEAVDYLARKPDLFAAAASPNPKTDSGQHCEAWFYAGMKKLFSGDKKTAANYFHKCLATEQKDFTEFQLAQSELQALGK